MSTDSENIRVVDSATKLDQSCRGAVLVCGSHGGEYPAWLVVQAGCRAVILNDAGIGKDEAGIGSLSYCETRGMAAATIDTNSARIGDAQDAFTRGVISRVNAIAAAFGVVPGMTCNEAAKLLERAKMPVATVESYQEARTVLTDQKVPVVLIDSASLIKPEDKGAIIITGSHGGLVGGVAAMALQVDGLAGIFHDAGGGMDGAGLSRLPALDQRGIAAATVSADSARIGDALSIYEDGVISHVNEAARRVGGKVGQTALKFVAAITNRIAAA